MGIAILALLVSLIFYLMVSAAKNQIKRVYRAFRNLDTNVFGQDLDTKRLFMQLYKAVPSSMYIDGVDIGKAYNHVKNNFGNLILDEHQFCSFNKEKARAEFNKTIFVLSNSTIVEVHYNCVMVLYQEKEYGFVNALITAMNEYRLPEKKVDYEINIITYSNHGLELKQLDINQTKLDIGMYYNEDFRPIDELVRRRLNQDKDKGIVLLHGLPGTGKTTYLRHLIGEVNKKVLFVSPTAASNLMNPEFIDLLIDNPNCIVVIEDAENIMMDRKFNRDSSVSNLLNMTDGLLSDCLSVQVVCTFNSKLDLIDSALMRKGRLIARYEFGKLTTEKAQKLSDHLGYDTTIRQPMTIAEIANQHEAESKPKTEAIGFMRSEVEMN